jgi:mannose-6-phosphate isomerase-like protein (cupin superfamily)
MTVTRDAETQRQTELRQINYKKPSLGGLRGITALASTDTISVIVQTLAPGGRQGLHAHGAYDGFYFVLAGRARFYGRDNQLFAEVGPNEGIFVPRGTPYAFEAAGREVQLLAIDGIDKTVKDTFVSHEPGSEIVNFEFFSPEGTRLNAQKLKMDTTEE